MAEDDTQLNIDAILEQLATQVRGLRNRAEVLERLKGRMEDAPPGCFSGMELDTTVEKLLEVRKQITTKSDELAKKIEVYEEQVSVLEAQLKTRKDILEQDMSVVQDVPDLMNVFASEHAQLLEKLKEAKRFLRD